MDHPIYEWHEHFREDCVSVDNDIRSGCLSTATHDQIVEHVQGIIQDSQNKSGNLLKELYHLEVVTVFSTTTWKCIGFANTLFQKWCLQIWKKHKWHCQETYHCGWLRYLQYTDKMQVIGIEIKINSFNSIVLILYATSLTFSRCIIYYEAIVSDNKNLAQNMLYYSSVNNLKNTWHTVLVWMLPTLVPRSSDNTLMLRQYYTKHIARPACRGMPLPLIIF